jgi:tetratricopeptide (TPR) repeat protein
MIMRRQLATVFFFAAIIVAADAQRFKVFAEPAAEPILSAVSISEHNACSEIKIDFNARVQYLSHFPIATGDELRIVLKPIGHGLDVRNAVVNQESLRAPANERASVHAIELETDTQGAALKVYFKHAVAYKIAPGSDFKSIVIAVPGSQPSATCEPFSQPANLADAEKLRGSLVPSQGGADGQNPKIQMPPEDLDRIMLEARAALQKGEHDRAIALLTRAGQAEDQRYGKEGQELLGIALGSKGQFTEARAKYQEYLQAYPKGADAERVRARLAGLDSDEKNFQSKTAFVPSVALPAPIGDGATGKKLLDEATKRWTPTGGPIDEKNDPDAWTVTHNGSAGLYYNRNQGGRDFFIPPRLQLGWDKENIYQLYQNSVLGSFDYEGRFDNADFTGRFHVSSSQENRYISGQTDETLVSALYFDGKHKGSGLSGRFGRQSGFSGGVLGRFDGALATYQASDDIKINAVGGAPVERSRDEPFANDAYFYGTSIDFDHVTKAIDTSLFLIEQRTEGVIDRQGVGSEFRFVDDRIAAFGTLDYDIHYMELNNAILTGTYVFPDFSTAGINFDYRRAPLIFTTNALQGQGVATLAELLKIYTLDEIERFSLDRTAESYSAGANYSHPISEHLQFSSDATVTYMSGTAGSGGVPAAPSTGTELYSSAQLTGMDVFATGDVYSGGVRFADTQSAYRYALEGSARYPITKDWHVGPMLRLGYADDKSDGRGEYELLPSLRSSYDISEDMVFDFEVGRKWIERETEHGIASETELTVLSGVRYNFHADR